MQAQLAARCRRPRPRPTRTPPRPTSRRPGPRPSSCARPTSCRRSTTPRSRSPRPRPNQSAAEAEQESAAGAGRVQPPDRGRPGQGQGRGRPRRVRGLPVRPAGPGDRAARGARRRRPSWPCATPTCASSSWSPRWSSRPRPRPSGSASWPRPRPSGPGSRPRRRRRNNRVSLDQLLIEQLPQIVREAAQGLSRANVTVLNGSEGLGELATGLVGQGLTIFESIRRGLNAPPPEADGGSEQKSIANEDPRPSRRQRPSA